MFKFKLDLDLCQLIHFTPTISEFVRALSGILKTARLLWRPTSHIVFQAAGGGSVLATSSL